MSTKQTWTGSHEKNWGVKQGAKQKSGGAMDHRGPPLESPLCVNKSPESISQITRGQYGTQ